MMKDFGYNLYSELMKLCCTKVCRIVTLLVIAFQSLLAYVSAKQVLSVGFDAVPTAENGLAEPLPPLEYMGFDVIMFATIPMIVLGAIFGAAEFKQHSLKTTLLYFGSKRNLFISKTLAVTIVTFFISLISTVFTITITHFTFGAEELKPFVFNGTVWKFIILSALSLTLLTLLSYAIAFLCRTAVVPLLFLIIQAYNVGNMLAEKFEVCRYLPVALSNGMIASSENAMTNMPLKNTVGLLMWIVLFIAAGYIVFRKIDLQGEY